MLLYGASLVYGFTGNTGFDEIAAVLPSGTRSLGLVFGLVFVLTGAGFKISAVAFPMSTTYVYEAAPTTARAHVSVPVTNAHRVCLLFLDIQKEINGINIRQIHDL